MPRITGCERNELIINDVPSASELGLYYRMPTTQERQGYLNRAVRRSKGGKVTMHHVEARMEYGMKILVGLRDGDFMRMDGGKAVPMSSDPNNPAYYPEWKAVMEAECGDLVMYLGMVVFDGLASVARDEGEEIEGE